MIKAYIPHHLIHRKNAVDKSEKKWVKVFYYKDRNRVEVPKENIDFIENEYDAFCVSLKTFQRQTFYKLSQLSNIDKTWDYYAILKKDVPDEFLKKCKRNEPTKFIGNPQYGIHYKPYSRRKKSDLSWKGKKPITVDIKKGKFVLNFD